MIWVKWKQCWRIEIRVTLLIAQVFQHYFDVMWLLASFDSSDFELFLDTVGIVSKKCIRKMVIQKDGHLWWSHGQMGQWTLLDGIYFILGQWYAFLLHVQSNSLKRLNSWKLALIALYTWPADSLQGARIRNSYRKIFFQKIH